MNLQPKYHTTDTVLAEYHYLPCVAYFAQLLPPQRVFLEAWEYYRKQSFRSRSRILTASGTLDIVVPVCHRSGKQVMRDMEICRTYTWERQHIQSLRSAYGKAPFFEHYSESLFDTLKKRFKFLTDLNLATLEWGLNAIGLKSELYPTEWYVKTAGPDVSDIREKIDAKKQLGGTMYTPCPYSQVFGTEFVANLSIADLLFCAGPDAHGILQKSAGPIRQNQIKTV